MRSTLVNSLYTMYLNQLWVLLFATLLFQSCIQPTQLASSFQEVDVEEPATIIVMRPNPLGTAVRNRVYHNGKLIGFTGVRSYLIWEVEPGLHSVGSSGENYDFVEVGIEAGKTYYFKQAQRPGLWKPRIELVALSEDQAMKTINKLKMAKLVERLPRSAYQSKI